MSSLVKYRVHEVAKDLGVPNKDIIDLLTANFEGEKKHMTVLEEKELDFVFEHYTKEYQAETFEAYFVAGDNERKRRETEKKAAEEEKRAAEEALKAEAQKAEEARKAEEAKKKKEAEEALRKEKEEKERKALEEKKAAEQRKQQQVQQHNQPQRQQQQRQQPQNNRPAQNKVEQKTFKPKPVSDNTQQNRQNRPVNNNPKPFEKQNKDKTNAPKPHHDMEVRVVDTRSSNVDLSKYDERLDELVPTNVKDTAARKQKLKKGSGRFQPSAPRRETEAEKLKRLELEKARRAPLKITIPDQIVVSELATRLKKTSGEVVKKLMIMGSMVSQNQVIDYETAAIVAEEFGAKYEREVVVTIEEQLIDDTADKAEDLAPRSPVVVVMGHVDHGKTSLLDAIRHSNVTEGEAGGITQHIGAYKVKVNDRNITFIDTPGHAAFTEMRARGANITDIAILVVAADDGIMPQTIEAIHHAKAAGVSIIVAINKMDKPNANPEVIKQSLTEYELVPEEWGGDTICVPVSAKKKTGIKELLEMVILTADMLELKANPNRLAKGTVIEAKLDKGRGPVATVLVQNGTLKSGDIVIAGSTVGRVRAMNDEKGRKLAEAGPSTPVEIIGMADVPEAGDLFYAVENEKMARELAEQRREQQRAEATKSTYAVSLDALFTQIQEGNIKELNIIVKADVQGSAEAVKSSLEKLSNDEVKVKVIHNGVGAITDSDIMLASASGAFIIGFNVRPDATVVENAKNAGVDIRTYRIIYECIEEVESAMKGMLAPKTREVVIGHAEVRQVYKISSVGTVAGCMIKDGKITRGSGIRVLRDSIVVAEDKIDSLKRFKDDAKEVVQGFECGIGLEKFNDIKEGDILEAYVIEEYRE
ncbi:MAG: translation initiation factor IF-2 [Bacillota bacterium]|nr:translation initiation factor IF-2 [Bacillota bacterium]